MIDIQKTPVLCRI